MFVFSISLNKEHTSPWIMEVLLKLYHKSCIGNCYFPKNLLISYWMIFKISSLYKCRVYYVLRHHNSLGNYAILLPR